jgi:hypothetical protein
MIDPTCWTPQADQLGLARTCHPDSSSVTRLANPDAQRREKMTTTLDARSTAPHTRSALGTMYVGLGLTVVALIVPYVDHATGNSLADHIRAGYPTYTQSRIDSAVTVYLIYLSVVGAAGVACWLWMIWAVKAGKRWARGIAAAIFMLATGIALFDLVVKDTSGYTGLPAWLGWTGMLPSIAGLLAVTMLWRTSAQSRSVDFGRR